MKRPVPWNLKLKLTFSNSVEPLLNAIFGCTRRPGQVVWSAWTTMTNRARKVIMVYNVYQRGREFVPQKFHRWPGQFFLNRRSWIRTDLGAEQHRCTYVSHRRCHSADQRWSHPCKTFSVEGPGVLWSGKNGQNFAAVLYRWPFFSLASAPFLYFIISIYV